LSTFERKRTSFAWIVVDSLCIILMSTVVQFTAWILFRLQYNAPYTYTVIFKAYWILQNTLHARFAFQCMKFIPITAMYNRIYNSKGKGLAHNRPSRWPKGVRVG